MPRISAAIITHTHSDHYLGLDDLASVAHVAGWLNDGLLPIYATPDNWPRIEATFGTSSARACSAPGGPHVTD